MNRYESTRPISKIQAKTKQKSKIIRSTGRRLSNIAKQIDNEGSAKLTNVTNPTEQENKANLWSSSPTRAKGDQHAPQTPGNEPIPNKSYSKLKKKNQIKNFFVK